MRIDDVEIRLGQAWASEDVRAALHDGSYEYAERSVLTATLTPDDVYLELGAGLGLLATLAGRTVAPGKVVAIEANPVMADVARQTTSRNGVDADVRNQILARGPRSQTTKFHVRADFRESSLIPGSATVEVAVPVADACETIRSIGATYLMIDIEGDETDLLQMTLPDSVTTLCIDTHSRVTGPAAQSAMVRRLLADGFTLEIDRCIPPVLLFSRERSHQRNAGR